MTNLTEVIELTGPDGFFSGANDIVPRVFLGQGRDIGEKVEHLFVCTFADSMP